MPQLVGDGDPNTEEWTGSVLCGDQRLSGRGNPGTAKGLVLLAMAAGWLSGAFQLAARAIRRWVIGEFLFIGPSSWWTTPVATVLVFLLFVPLALVAARWVSRDRVWFAFATVCLFLGLFSSLNLFPQIHRLASLLVALGLALQLGRLSDKLGPRRWPLLRRAAVAGSVLTLTAALYIELDPGQTPAKVPARGTEASRLPNLLLIVLDTERSASMSLHGYRRETTPVLDSLAAGGVVFDLAVSTSPWTLPSHASIFTGRYVHEITADWLVPLDDEWPTLAEVLGALGYRTAGFAGNTNYASREVGLGRGFQHYDDYPFSLEHVLRANPLTAMVARDRRVREFLGQPDALGRRHAPEITDRLLRWLDGLAGQQPFFIFANYYDAHRPYHPPEPYRSRFVPPGEGLDPRPFRNARPGDDTLESKTAWARNAYDGAIAYLDAELRRLFQELARRGVLDNTIVVITSDHGEEFGEHQVFDHGNTLYRQAIQVPLIWLFPGAPAGMRIAQPVSLAAIPRTVMGLIDSALPHPFPRKSLAPLWQGDSSAAVSPAISEVRKVVRQPEWYPASQGALASLTTDSWRYIRNVDTGEEELFALSDDRDANDLVESEGSEEILQYLRSRLDSLRQP